MEKTASTDFSNRYFHLGKKEAFQLKMSHLAVQDLPTALGCHKRAISLLCSFEPSYSKLCWIFIDKCWKLHFTRTGSQGGVITPKEFMMELKIKVSDLLVFQFLSLMLKFLIEVVYLFMGSCKGELTKT